MFKLGPPVQIAYAVVDAHDAARKWVEGFGAGPFFIAEHIPVTNVVHRGTPAVFDHTSAYGQWGEIMVELVQDHGEGPSAVRDLYAPGESGLHHVAYFVDDLDEATAELAKRGFPLAMSAEARGETRFHFVDAVAELGHFLELYELSPELKSFYEKVRDEAIGWDGSNPIRTR